MYEKIKELCKRQGISISKLEKQVGLGNGTIGKWGKYGRRPKYENLKAIADIFDVSVSYLAGEEQKEKSTSVFKNGSVDWDKLLDGCSQDELKSIMEKVMEKFIGG